MGATDSGGGQCRFRVWAPLAARVEVRIVHPHARTIPLEPLPRGYYEAIADDVQPGARYWFRLDEARDRPDPASRFQPEGVHGPSEVVSPEFEWRDGSWRGLPIDHYIFYELHTGTFTPEGTFDAAIPRLAELADLGVTAVEIMPVAQFPGSRNWGYDGAYPFAVQYSYGGPQGLKRLVDACHRHGMAAVLDVVYNHLGPEGNYFREFGPYFTDRYVTPWGQAVNLDGRGSDEVRRFLLENALYWLEELHFDALRLDAVHEIHDESARPFLNELTAAVAAASRRLGRLLHIVPESDRNDARLVLPAAQGGTGCTAHWSDDLHHALHCVLTGESRGYYADFGGIAPLAKALRQGYVYTGDYSEARGRSHGSSTECIEGRQFVVCAQNHDQIGNRMSGDRLGHLVPFESQKLAAGVVLLSPFLPLLFMGEEYGETAPFLYFVSHSDADLIEAVRKGRKEEFAAFAWEGEPPDPQSEGTFLGSKLHWELRAAGRHRMLLELYRELIRLRKTRPALALVSKRHIDVEVCGDGNVLYWRRWNGADEAVAMFHFGERTASVSAPVPKGEWRTELYSADRRWGGSAAMPEQLESAGRAALELAPRAFVLFSR